MKDIEAMFEAYGIRLPLLKALIDRLLQDGIEDLLLVLSTSKKTKDETHTSNVITEYTTVSGLPDTGLETVLLTQEDSLKKNSGQKKKNRERGKTTEEDQQDKEEEEEFYYGEEYSAEQEEDVHPDDPSVSQERKNNRQGEQSSTHSPAQLETLTETASHSLKLSSNKAADTTLDVTLMTTEPPSQSTEDTEQDEVSLPTPPITTEEPDKDLS